MDMEHFDSDGSSSIPPNKPRPLLICKTCNVCVHDSELLYHILSVPHLTKSIKPDLYVSICFY